jgi:hypothetical protein
VEDEPATDAHVDASTEEILESLLVDDAEIAWDPKTGKPHVTRRPQDSLETDNREKSTLDRPPGTP